MSPLSLVPPHENPSKADLVLFMFMKQYSAKYIPVTGTVG
jgi:hypothetical protein